METFKQEEIELDETCGFEITCGPHRSKRFPAYFCQALATSKWALVFLSLGAVVQGFLVNGHTPVVISTLERRFELTSTESGLISSCYDIASSLTILFVTYYGGHGHKPLWIGWGMFLIGISGVIFSLPHFTASYYSYNEDRNVCGNAAEETCVLSALKNFSLYVHFMINHQVNVLLVRLSGRGDILAYFNVSTFCNYPLLAIIIIFYRVFFDHQERKKLIRVHLVQWFHTKFVFYGALLLAGAGAAPLYSLSITYLDENVKQRYSSLYNAILIAMSVVGPGVGFLVGASFLTEYTYPSETVSITESSELWVGAWWIGSLLFGLIGVIISIPILMLPREIHGTKRHRVDREKEIHVSSKEHNEDEDFGKTIKDLPRCILILLRNPTFVFLSLGIAIDSFLIGGMATFGAKYIETQFGIDASDAGIYFGLMAILGGAGGQLVGGGVIAKFNFGVKKMLHMSYIAPILAACSCCCYLITCSQQLVAGLTTPYHDGTLSATSVTALCNTNCGCSEGVYNPVCGNDKITYFSSCFAGCADEVSGVYSNCSCIAATSDGSGPDYSLTTAATSGACLDKRCSSGWELILFCFFNFVLMFLTFFNEASALQVSLRCVPFKRRSFAIGMQILFTRIVGTIPGPLVVGAIFDRACLQWTVECGVRGACLAYSNTNLALFIFLFIIIGKAVDIFLFLGAFFTYKPVPGAFPDLSFDDNDSNSSEPQREARTPSKKYSMSEQSSNISHVSTLPGTALQ